MNILVIAGSPKGKDSITLHTCLYLEKKFPQHRFIEDNCADMGIRFLDGLSADMDDILSGEKASTPSPMSYLRRESNMLS